MFWYTYDENLVFFWSFKFWFVKEEDVFVRKMKKVTL